MSQHANRPTVFGRRIAAVAGSALVASALAFTAAGCAQRPEITITQDGVTVSNGDQTRTYALPSAAQSAENRTITVTGTDSVLVEPDTAEVAIGVVGEGADADTARRKAVETVEDVRAALEDAGVAADDIVTNGLYLNPHYDYSSSSETIAGYEMRVELRVKGLALGQAGEAISIATAAGASSVDGVSYYRSDYDAQYEKALAAALEMAREKAEAICLSTGGSLGSAVSISEGYDGQTYRGNESTWVSGETAMAMDAKAEAGGAVPVNPGTIEIEATVTVEYEVAPAR